MPVRIGKRQRPFSMRWPAQTRDAIVKAAEKSGRSINDEINYRLEHSLWEDSRAETSLLRKLLVTAKTQYGISRSEG